MSTESLPVYHCSGCGAALPAAANFCLVCGRACARRSELPVAKPSTRQPPVAALVVFVVMAAAGIAALQFAAPAGSTSRAVPGTPSAPAAAAGSAELPSNHPPLDLPPEVLAFLEDLTKAAEAAPQDVDAWKKLARARYRASLLDPGFRDAARKSLAHIFELAPDDTEALRMLANIDYEAQQFAEAEKSFRRYLKIDPADPGVRTDLASSVLFQGRSDEALAMYRDVIASHPEFVQAHVNLGIALHGNDKREEAMKSFERARDLAEDAEQRGRIDEIIAMAEGRAPQALPGRPTSAPGTAAAARGAPESNAASAFQKGVDGLLSQHAIVSPKIRRIDWTGAATAAVHLSGFPMDAMPPVVRNKFKSTMNEKIAALAAESGTSAVRIELVDDADGRVMDTLDGEELIGAFDQPQDQ